MKKLFAVPTALLYLSLAGAVLADPIVTTPSVPVITTPMVPIKYVNHTTPLVPPQPMLDPSVPVTTGGYGPPPVITYPLATPGHHSAGKRRRVKAGATPTFPAAAAVKGVSAKAAQ